MHLLPLYGIKNSQKILTSNEPLQYIAVEVVILEIKTGFTLAQNWYIYGLSGKGFLIFFNQQRKSVNMLTSSALNEVLVKYF